MSIAFAANGDVAYITQAPAALQPLTMACWMQRDAPRGEVVFLMWQPTAGLAYIQGLVLDGMSNDLLAFVNSPQEGTPYFPVVNGQWLHVAYTRSGNVHTLYVNSVLIHTFTDAHSNTPGITAFGGNGGTGWLDGRVAHGRVWEAALTPEELFIERQNIVPMRTTDLWGAWPMSSDGLDISGNGRHLTVVGSYEADPPIGPRATAFQMNAF